MEDLEQVYDLIFHSDGLSKAEIRKRLKIKKELSTEYLDTLYQYGFIDWEGGKYVGVPDEMIPKLYLERNVDLNFLREEVNMELVESIFAQEFGDVVEELKAEPVKDMEWKIMDLERKMKVLDSLYMSFKEMRRIK
ncbi:MAG: hypothetical protein V3V92_00060 [Candidatus Hydrothermarchaeales archaeon]